MKRILFVDDEPAIRQLAIDMLEGVYEVVTAASLHEAFTQLQQGHFAGIVLDLGLPDSEGWGTLGQLSDFQAANADLTPVMVLTGSLPDGARPRILVQPMLKGATMRRAVFLERINALVAEGERANREFPAE